MSITAKEFLRKGYKLNEKIQSSIRELEQTKDLAESISVAYGSERVQTSMKGDKIPNAVSAIVDLEHEIEKETLQFVELKKQIRDVIESVKNPDRNLLLRMRYIEFRSWADIQEAMEFVDSETMFKLHGRALKQIDRSGILLGSNVQ